MEACLSTVGGRVFFLSFSDSVTIRERTPFSVRLFLLGNRLKPFINKEYRRPDSNRYAITGNGF